MKIEITETGFLLLGRGAGLRSVSCPHREGGCGDNCALFGEPEEILDRVFLGLCQAEHSCKLEDFKDRRG